MADNQYLNILLAEDNPDDADLLIIHLKREGLPAKVTVVTSKNDYEYELSNNDWDVIISDYSMIGFDGMEALEILQKSGKDIPFILISGTIGEDIAVGSVLSGASDYLLKDNLTRLKTSIQREVGAKKLRDEKKEQEQELVKREKRFQNLFMHSIDGIIISELDKRVLTANQTACDILGYSAEELSELARENLADLSDERTKEAYQIRRKKGAFHGNLIFFKKNGDRIPVEASSKIYEVAPGEFQTSTIFRDISERLESERKIQESLKEKEIMIAEIHHRVKNNMAIISGMLQLQIENSEDELLQASLRQSVHRIKSMALVHEMLYGSESMSSIDIGQYIEELIAHLCANSGTGAIRYKVKKTEQYFDITKAIPCGLIVNELLTNALKHAFKNGDDGEITITMATVDSGFRFKISDNGPGMSDLSLIDDSKTLGYAIINSLVKQLNGEIKVYNEAGFTAEVTIPIESEVS